MNPGQEWLGAGGSIQMSCLSSGLNTLFMWSMESPADWKCILIIARVIQTSCMTRPQRWSRRFLKRLMICFQSLSAVISSSPICKSSSWSGERRGKMLELGWSRCLNVKIMREDPWHVSPSDAMETMRECVWAHVLFTPLRKTWMNVAYSVPLSRLQSPETSTRRAGYIQWLSDRTPSAPIVA